MSRLKRSSPLPDVISGKDLKDSTTVDVAPVKLNENLNLQAVKIGIPREYHCKGLSKEVLGIWKSTAHLLQEAGAHVSQVFLESFSS